MKLLCKRILSGLLVLGLGLSGVSLQANATALSPKNANAAYGKSVAFYCGGEVTADSNYGIDAIKAGLSVLTDGVNDSPNWWVNNGNPNIGLKSSVLAGDYVFNLDIGVQSSVSRISTYFYSRTAWGVDAPDSVTYSVSTDGIKWTQVGSVSKTSSTITTLADDRNPTDQAPSIYTFTLLMDALDARYVKVCRMVYQF